MYQETATTKSKENEENVDMSGSDVSFPKAGSDYTESLHYKIYSNLEKQPKILLQTDHMSKKFTLQ